MLSPFICGSFHNQDDEEYDNNYRISPCSTPTRKTRKSLSRDKNPYATRGLDKFSALLAELEEKRQKIYSQVGSQDISFVRFVYSSSNDFVPVIVKVKDPQSKRNSIDSQDQNKDHDQKVSKAAENKAEVVDKETKMVKKKVYFKLHKWRRPSYYMPVFVILILLFLAVFGRSVAILCTSIGWYLVPTLSSKTSAKQAKKSGSSLNSGLKKKKELVRRFSEVGPRAKSDDIGSNGKESKSPHGRQNSF